MAVDSDAGVNLVKKRNTKSIVWTYFGIKATEDGLPIEAEQERPLCRPCGRAVLAKGGNTTNLFQHLREHHPDLYAEASPKITRKSESSSSTQLSLTESIAKTTKYSRSSPQAYELNRAVAYYLAKDAVPLYTIEKPGFRQMIAKINPKYDLPSRKYFSTHEIPALYSHVRDKVVLPALTQIQYYAVTTDLWTSGACDPYITLTVHFLDNELESSPYMP